LISEQFKWKLSLSLLYYGKHLLQILSAFSYGSGKRYQLQQSNLFQIAEKLCQQKPIAKRIIADISVLKFFGEIMSKLQIKEPFSKLTFDFICYLYVLMIAQSLILSGK
jgi:hypothetical protein